MSADNAYLSEKFNTTPANRLFGFVVQAQSADGARVVMPVREEFLQEEGVVHGGIISALADTTAVVALYPTLADGEAMTSIEFKVNFLRSAVVDGGDLVATSRIVRRGRTIALADVDVHQDDRHVAKGLFTYTFFERRTPT